MGNSNRTEAKVFYRQRRGISMACDNSSGRTIPESKLRKASQRRIDFARAFLDRIIAESLGDDAVYGKTIVEIHWKGGEVPQVDVNPGRSFQ